MSAHNGPRPPVYRVVLVRERAGPHYALRRADAAARVFSSFFAGFDREGFAVALLDTKLKLIGVNLVSLGSLNQTVVLGREVFKPAILANAEKLILSHNHPSGEVTPSEEDRILTDRLVQAGKLLGIEVLDHIVVAPDGTFFSFQENGLISPR
ncbi:MAG: JAB domain-containing protein [bacterium]